MGIVEIKCKRCGSIVKTESFEFGTLALLESNPELHITLVSGDVQTMFNYERDQLLGKHLGEFFPLFKNTHTPLQTHTRNSSKPYVIQNKTFLLRDGTSGMRKSYIVPKKEKGAFSGYRIINWI